MEIHSVGLSLEPQMHLFVHMAKSDHFHCALKTHVDHKLEMLGEDWDVCRSVFKGP